MRITLGFIVSWRRLYFSCIIINKFSWDKYRLKKIVITCLGAMFLHLKVEARFSLISSIFSLWPSKIALTALSSWILHFGPVSRGENFRTSENILERLNNRHLDGQSLNLIRKRLEKLQSRNSMVERVCVLNSNVYFNSVNHFSSTSRQWASEVCFYVWYAILIFLQH